MIRLAVHAHPGSRRRAVVLRGDEFEVYVAARAVDGAANDEIRRALAGALDVPVRDVTLVRGAHARHKVVAIAGDEDQLTRRLDALRAREANPMSQPSSRESRRPDGRT